MAAENSMLYRYQGLTNKQWKCLAGAPAWRDAGGDMALDLQT